MNVSSAAPTDKSSLQVDVLKKALNSQEDQVLKVLNNSDKQLQDVQAQENVSRQTGIGSNLNIKA
jgi:hypothetical protein